MRLWIIRHGETKGNQAGILRGASSANDEITDTGHEQARAMAGRISGGEPRPQAVYASRYRRAQQTARPLAERLGVPVTVLPGIHEVDCGEWAGEPYSALRQHPERLELGGGELGFRGGETFREIAARFTADVNSLPDGDAALVSHGGIIRIALADLLGLDIREVWRGGDFMLGNTEWVVLERQGGIWSLLE
ncbi:histidine phosphatase family protein [Deinococcus sp. JMULE3]|uniref:histidine phosphatase family protein n=1 Tax=Deinococcus sp. JMULE3 TaxID=2518341 RepID=UPI0015774226|nr:histidine phosphatase family protein [Deinococcus sp. JMULE3]NTX99395.1 histidine phosphatase family protein [Deinococcus sp. JMULE3]